jgi:branched-chain amino acid transport system substrate-binding protein
MANSWSIRRRSNGSALVRRSLTMIAAFLLCSATLAIAPARSAEPFTINAVLSLTGSGAFLGQAQAEGYRMVEAAVNQAGGMDGMPIRIAIADDQSSPQVAGQLAADFVARKVSVILGGTLVAPCRVIAAQVEQTGPFFYCISNGFQPKRGGYVNSINFSTIDSIAAMLRYFKGRGWNRIAYIVSTDATGQDAETNINTALATHGASGIQIVAREHFNPTDISVTAQMTRIKATNPQAIIAWATGSPLGTLLRGLQDTALNMPVGTSAGNMVYSEMKQYDALMPENLYFTSSLPLATGARYDKGVAPSLAAFKKAVAQAGVPMQQGHAFAWDSAFNTLAALKKYGLNATAEQIRDFIAQQSALPGACGIYNFVERPQRGLGIENAYVARWDKGRSAWIAVSDAGGAPLRGH